MIGCMSLLSSSSVAADEKKMMTYSMAMGTPENHPGNYLLTLKFENKVLPEDVRIYLMKTDGTDVVSDELVLDDYLVISSSTRNSLVLAFPADFFRNQIVADTTLEVIYRYGQDIFDYVKEKYAFRKLEKTLKPVRPEGRTVKRKQ